MANKLLVFRVHAIQRMAQRGITVEDVRHVLDAGEVIEDYPNDFPYPSALVLGWKGRQAIHVVAATTPLERIVITVYEPDLTRWEPDLKRRKP
ncbi:MAG: DUF4258 domain-containing protein [Bryobacteraceae bacterium]